MLVLPIVASQLALGLQETAPGRAHYDKAGIGAKYVESLLR